VQKAVRMQDFQVLTNRNLRGFELAREITHQHAAIAPQ